MRIRDTLAALAGALRRRPTGGTVPPASTDPDTMYVKLSGPQVLTNDEAIDEAQQLGMNHVARQLREGQVHRVALPGGGVAWLSPEMADRAEHDDTFREFLAGLNEPDGRWKQ